MNIHRTLLSCITALSICLPSAQADDNEAVVLLNKMTHALHHLNYTGTLVFIKDNQASTLSIEHINQGNMRKESIQPMDNQGVQVVRELSSLPLTSLPQIDKSMEQIYSFDIGSTAKVAGQPCRTVLARPKDRKRFLKKFCIDENDGFLRQYTLINKKHQIVEQLLFTDVVILPSDDNTAESTSAATVPMTLMSSDTIAETATSPWSIQPMPRGFKIIATEQGNNPLVEEQIILSDGLSTVSIFIANSQAQSAPMVKSSGALNILSMEKLGKQITLLGEVPKSTLQEIYKGLNKTPSP